MTNVHSFGAVGNGSSDDLAAINSTIADIVTIESGRIRKGDNLEFNSRMYRVSDTVHFGKHFGTQIVGKGAIPQQFNVRADGGPNINTNFFFIGTQIIGDSLESGVIDIQGSNVGLRDISIVGRTGNAEAKSAVGIQYTKNTGIGTGKSRIYDVSIVDCDAGIRFGNAQGDGNCDLVVCDRLLLRNCTSGVQMVNDQALGNNFQSVYALDCGTAFDLDAGGKIQVGHVGVKSTDELMRTRAQGNGNGQITFQNVHIDASDTTCPRLVNSANTAGSHTILFNSIHVPKSVGANDDPLFTLNDGDRVIVKGAQYLQGTLANFVHGGNLRLENCIFEDYDNVTFWKEGSTGNFRFEMVNCYSTDNTPLDDILFISGALSESGSATLMRPNTSNITNNTTKTTGTGAGSNALGTYSVGGSRTRITR